MVCSRMLLRLLLVVRCSSTCMRLSVSSLWHWRLNCWRSRKDTSFMTSWCVRLRFFFFYTHPFAPSLFFFFSSCWDILHGSPVADTCLLCNDLHLTETQDERKKKKREIGNYPSSVCYKHVLLTHTYTHTHVRIQQEKKILLFFFLSCNGLFCELPLCVSSLHLLQSKLLPPARWRSPLY